MRHKKLRLSAILLLVLGLPGLHAQEAIPTAGSNASGSGGSASYTVGQVVYFTKMGTNGSVAEGIQQPFEISTITGLKEANNITLECLTYPNPVKDIIKLKIKDSDNTNLSYQLFDLNGKLIQNKKLESNETRIVIRNLTPATYILKVIKGKNEIKSFKILKN